MATQRFEDQRLLSSGRSKSIQPAGLANEIQKEFGSDWLDSLRPGAAESQDSAHSKFVEVELNGHPQAEPAGEIITTLWEIKTPAGYCVSVRGGMPPSVLVALLKQMKEAEC